jgi:hypothetical protein
MKAHELLAERHKWTQNAEARSHTGTPCRWDSDRATCWCAIGAIKFCYELSGMMDAYDKAIEAADRIHGERKLSWVNDSFGYEAVMQVLREADV